MGGRGASGLGSGRISKDKTENEILTQDPYMRMSYKDYKRYDVGYGVDGTYDKETKTIEVNIGRCVKAIMNVLPESYVKETNLSRAKAAQKLYFDIGNGLITVDGNAPAWAKKAYKLAKVGWRLDNRYRVNHDKTLDFYYGLKKDGY